jgi:hypothetical protein
VGGQSTKEPSLTGSMPHRLGLIEQISGAIEQIPGRGSERLSGIGPMMWERENGSLLQHLSHMQSEEADVRPALLTEALARLAPQPQRPGPFSSGEFVDFLLPHLRRRSHCCRRAASPSAMAATNKCLARNNKSRTGRGATKKWKAQNERVSIGLRSRRLAA